MWMRASARTAARWEEGGMEESLGKSWANGRRCETKLSSVIRGRRTTTNRPPSRRRPSMPPSNHPTMCRPVHGLFAAASTKPRTMSGLAGSRVPASSFKLQPPSFLLEQAASTHGVRLVSPPSVTSLLISMRPAGSSPRRCARMTGCGWAAFRGRRRRPSECTLWACSGLQIDTATQVIVDCWGQYGVVASIGGRCLTGK